MTEEIKVETIFEGVASTHVVYGRKFKTKMFPNDKKANAYLEKNKDHGVLHADPKTGVVHVAHMDDKGEKISEEVLAEKFGEFESLSDKPHVFKNDKGSTLTVKSISENEFELSHVSKSGKQWSETHSRNQTVSMVDTFFNKGLSEKVSDEVSLIEEIVNETHDAKNEIYTKLYDLVAEWYNSVEDGEYKLQIDETNNPFRSKEWPAKTHRKIDIYHKGSYKGSTNAYKTLKDARRGFAHQHQIDNHDDIKANYTDNKPKTI